MPTQNSKLCYVPHGLLVDGANCGLVDGGTSVTAIDNDAGIMNPDLSDYTIITANHTAQDYFGFTVFFNIDHDVIAAADTVFLALIGCSLITYEDDGGTPDLDTAVAEDILANITALGFAPDLSYRTYSQCALNNIASHCAVPLPSIISGGYSNLVFSGMEKETTFLPGQIEAGITVRRLAANVSARPHSVFTVGHLMAGVELPITIDPTTFAWSAAAESKRFVARDGGVLSSEGTLLRRSAGEILKIPQSRLTGFEVTTVEAGLSSYPTVLTKSANFHDLVKVNNSYPILLNPFPYPLLGTGNYVPDDYNFTARQNHFSIYGFLDEPIELRCSEYRDGLNSEYRARFSIRETR